MKHIKPMKRWKKHEIAAGGTLVFLAVILALNLLFSYKNFTLDLTDSQLYSLSDETRQILKKLDKNVTIYIMNDETQTSSDYKRVFDNYAKYKSIQIEYKDPELYPNFTKEYVDSAEEVPTDSAIVVCGEKSRYLSSYDYISYSYDSSYNMQADSLDIERLFTQAICYVTEETTPVLYTLTGHGETDLPSNMTQRFEGVNYSVASLNLLSEGNVPEDCAVLIINGPTKDLSEAEIQAVQTYLDGGGKGYICLDASAEKLTRLYDLMKTYRIGVTDGILVENNSQMYMQYPTYLLPSIESADATSAQYNQNVNILAIGSKGLTNLAAEEEEDGEYTVEELLTTSEEAYAKVDMSSTTYEKEKNDVDGPFAVAVQSSHTDGGKLIVCGTLNLMDEQVDAYVSGANTDFIVNGINALTEQEQKIAIRNASITYDTIVVPAFYQKMILVVSIFVIPVAFLLVGIGVVLRRRKL